MATLEQLRKEGLAVNTFLTAEHKVRTSCVAHCSGGIYQGTYSGLCPFKLSPFILNYLHVFCQILYDILISKSVMK